MGNTTHPLLVVGVGIGAPDIPSQAADGVKNATVLAAGKRILAAFAGHPAEKIPLRAPLAPILGTLAERRAAGGRVVVLADGDPLFFGIGRTLLSRFAPGTLRFVPNVTAVAAMAARLGRPWQDIPVVSLHGRSDHTALYQALMRAGQAAVYTDAVNTPSALARAVLHRAGDAFALHVFENLGLADENHTSLTLPVAANLPDDAFSPLNLVFLERLGPPEIPLTLGLSDAALSRDDTVFTKLPSRAVALALLGVRVGDVVWDLGAGTGSVALEASRLCPAGRVFAVEKHPGRFEHLRRNIQKTGALTVTPILAALPDALESLPDPDRIFIGGGLSQNPDILNAAAKRLAPNGRIVVAATLLATLEHARTFFAQHAWTCRTTHIQTSTETPLGRHHRLTPDNPVFLVAGERECGERASPPPHTPPPPGGHCPPGPPNGIACGKAAGDADDGRE
ncbi:precorrin-6y C5,15-methyltransferase (decarboxylating) subunit CbiE [Desulfolutivibrio sulfodismutans DSM 3696]|nr:precorrin-6y C5,15-methyltransferase (decarboxylating) subunit CbiE [Desulfolutivibrio sulfodismutans DSM 3696]